MSPTLSKKILAWYDNSKRSLPWRVSKKSPKKLYYRILSEFMLQQTQVKTVIPYFYRFINEFEGGSALDNRLIAFESFNFIFLMLGLGATYLNKDSPQLTYYKTAVYPVYIVHFPVQMVLMSYFAGVNLHPIIKFPLVLFLIIFVSLTIYHAIKNIKFLRPLFGLRNK